MNIRLATKPLYEPIYSSPDAPLSGVALGEQRIAASTDIEQLRQWAANREQVEVNHIDIRPYPDPAYPEATYWEAADETRVWPVATTIAHHLTSRGVTAVYALINPKNWTQTPLVAVGRTGVIRACVFPLVNLAHLTKDEMCREWWRP